MTRIEIDHLDIRMRNVSRDSINSIVDGLGLQLLDRIYSSLANIRDDSPIGQVIKIDHLEAGIVSKGPGTGSDLQGSIAESIVRSITHSISGSRTGSVSSERGASAGRWVRNSLPERRTGEQ